MKQMKKLSALAVGSMAIALLLGTNLAQAQDVCVDGDTVIGIKGLDVITEEFDQTTMDVDFQYTTGFEIYGSNLQNLPFGQAFGEDDAASVRASINNALNAESSVPDFAGRPDQIEYYIGVEEEQGAGLGAVAAWAAANYTGDEWAPCEKELTEDCLAGSRILPAADLFTYAHLTKAVTGASCNGGAPPPEEEPPTTSYTITPCITGSWYLDARDGEGYNIEIIGSELDPQVLAYFYTYDDDGNQMWVTGVGPANGDTAIVPVEVFSGPVYGDAYDRGDLDREDWGTLTFTFTTKDTGSVVRASTIGFGTTTEDIIRLTSVTGLACP
jgi:hypothetical protein